jgi:hypothetical protein
MVGHTATFAYHLQSKTLARTHTCSTDPAIVESTGGRLCFGIFLSLEVELYFMSPMVAKCFPMRSIFRVWNSQNSLGAICGEYVVGSSQESISQRGIAALQAMCGSVRYREAETTVPATCRAASSELHRATSEKHVRRKYK